MTNERWTLYDRYEEDTDGNIPELGNYKLYKYDGSSDDGLADDPWFEDVDGDGVRGTDLDVVAYNEKIKKEDPEHYIEKELRVAKKQKKTVAKDLADEDVITLKGDGSWSAYKVEDINKGEYTRIYPNEDENTVKGKFYYREVFNEAIVQKEDGVRATTNVTIKDLFMNRYYFSYDGTTETANIIKELRDKLGMEKDKRYGNISKDKLDKEFTVNVEYVENTKDSNGKKKTEVKQKTETVKVRDYVSKVSLTHDSLAAFSMLENTHTMDADYIYKDFKELIVELGYFTKEELSDGRPRLMQFLVPEIGSAGYPIRALDKSENEFGTLAHSKEDYENNEKDTLRKMMEEIGKDGNPDEKMLEEARKKEEQRKNESSDKTTDVKGISGLELNLSSSNIKIDEVGAISANKKPSQVTVTEFLKSTREMCEYINEVGYDYCVLNLVDGCSTCVASGCVSGKKCLKPSGCSCTTNHCKHQHHSNPCGLATSFKKSKESTSKQNLCCATLVSWALQEVGVMPEADHIDGADTLAAYCVDKLKGKKIEKKDTLKPGDILCYPGHIDICGETKEGGFVKYNGGAEVKPGAKEGESGSCIQKISGWPSKALYAVRLDWGNNDEPYEGFEGGEAVVAPVTGILLDYGTYEKVEVDPNADPSADPAVPADPTDPNAEGTDSKYRQNADRKDKIDAVGYAKILVLNEEVSDQLVTCTNATHRKEALDQGIDIGEGMITFNKDESEYPDTLKLAPKDEEEVDKMSDFQKAIYGYSLFAKSYEDAHIGGYIVYIDGFECKLPSAESDDELTDDTDPDAAAEAAKNKDMEDTEELSMEYFIEKAATGTTGSEFKATTYVETRYEPDPVYNLMSETLENKEKAKSKAKELASNLYYFEGSLDEEVQDLLIIKEGTVIGRTVNNKYLVNKIREEDYEGSSEVEKEDGTMETVNEKDQVQGNYLRLIMRDLDDTVVENVEEYIKLDELSKKGLFGDLEAIDENSTIEEKIIAAMNYLVDQGFSEEGAAGILGNIYQESTFGPTADNGSHRGLCQWNYTGDPESPTGGRWKTIFDWMQEEGYNHDSFAGQIRAIVESPDADNYKQYFDQIKSASSVSDAADVWCRHYEICGNYDTEVPRRTKFGEAALKVYYGETDKFTVE